MGIPGMILYARARVIVAFGRATVMGTQVAKMNFRWVNFDETPRYDRYTNGDETLNYEGRQDTESPILTSTKTAISQ